MIAQEDRDDKSFMINSFFKVPGTSLSNDVN